MESGKCDCSTPHMVDPSACVRLHCGPDRQSDAGARLNCAGSRTVSHEPRKGPMSLVQMRIGAEIRSLPALLSILGLLVVSGCGVPSALPARPLHPGDTDYPELNLSAREIVQ